MIKGITVGLVCFMLFILHIFILHYFKIKRRFFFIFSLFFSMLLVYTVLFQMVSEDWVEKIVSFLMPIFWFDFAQGIVCSMLLFYSYLYVIQVIDRSPSTRIMVELDNSPKKKLELEQIKNAYSISKKISAELEDMVILGRLKKEADFYSLTPKGKTHILIFKYIRNYLKLRRS